jgi:hypothetical protein
MIKIHNILKWNFTTNILICGIYIFTQLKWRKRNFPPTFWTTLVYTCISKNTFLISGVCSSHDQFLNLESDITKGHIAFSFPRFARSFVVIYLRLKIFIADTTIPWHKWNTKKSYLMISQSYHKSQTLASTHLWFCIQVCWSHCIERLHLYNYNANGLQKLRFLVYLLIPFLSPL